MAMARNVEREIVTADMEFDTDAMAALAARDMAEEAGELAPASEGDGLPPMWVPARGDWVVIYTGSFFHCGQLTGVDHEQYGLAPGSVLIDETGRFEQFYSECRCSHGERQPCASVVRKGPTTQVTRWPFSKPCDILNKS